MSKSNLAEKFEPVDYAASSQWITEKYGVHHYDPATDKLARQMWMPKGLRPKNAAFGTGSAGSKAASTAKNRSKKPKLTLVKNGKSEPGQRPKVTATDLVDGRKFGKRIITIRRKQGKRACQHIGKRLLVIAERNVGRGQVFYLSAAYGVMESR